MRHSNTLVSTFITDKLSKVVIGNHDNDRSFTLVESVDLLVKLVEKYNIQPSEIKFYSITQFNEACLKCPSLLKKTTIHACFQNSNTPKQITEFFSHDPTRKLDNYNFKQLKVHCNINDDILIEQIPCKVEELELINVNVVHGLFHYSEGMKKFKCVTGNLMTYCKAFDYLPSSIIELDLDVSSCHINAFPLELPGQLEKLTFKVSQSTSVNFCDVSYLKNLDYFVLDGLDISLSECT